MLARKCSNNSFNLGTIYPGLMLTSAALYHAMNFLHISIDVRNVCVFLAPLFSSLTTIVTFLLTKELKVIFLFYFIFWKILNQIMIIFTGYWGWTGCCIYDCNCSWIHLSFSCRFLWQWRHRNFLHVAHIVCLSLVQFNFHSWLLYSVFCFIQLFYFLFSATFGLSPSKRGPCCGAHSVHWPTSTWLVPKNLFSFMYILFKFSLIVLFSVERFPLGEVMFSW